MTQTILPDTISSTVSIGLPEFDRVYGVSDDVFKNDRKKNWLFIHNQFPEFMRESPLVSIGSEYYKGSEETVVEWLKENNLQDLLEIDDFESIRTKTQFSEYAPDYTKIKFNANLLQSYVDLNNIRKNQLKTSQEDSRFVDEIQEEIINRTKTIEVQSIVGASVVSKPHGFIRFYSVINDPENTEETFISFSDPFDQIMNSSTPVIFDSQPTLIADFIADEYQIEQ